MIDKLTELGLATYTNASTGNWSWAWRWQKGFPTTGFDRSITALVDAIETLLVKE